mgnify:CR=1 FL=1
MVQMETVLSICHNLLVLITVFLHFLKALVRRDSETETYFSRPRHLSSETETFLSRPRRDRDFRNPVSRLSRDETSVSRLPSLGWSSSHSLDYHRRSQPRLPWPWEVSVGQHRVPDSTMTLSIIYLCKWIIIFFHAEGSFNICILLRLCWNYKGYVAELQVRRSGHSEWRIISPTSIKDDWSAFIVQ